ncbi:GntR family transcriptional regulator [Streptomyces chartreusis]
MGLDPLTKRKIYLYEQAATLPQAEKVRTKLLHQVDENRHPKTQVTMSFLLDRWLGVAELDESSYERAEGIIRNYLKPTFGELKAAKLNAEMLELFYAREDGAVALCGQCESEVQAQPDAAVSPMGRTNKMEAASPRELAPWEVIAKDLADAIKDGTMLPGEDVPTVGDIAQSHGVSVGTAHRAFAQLRKDGLIEVSRGRRGVVSPRQEKASDAA